VVVGADDASGGAATPTARRSPRRRGGSHVSAPITARRQTAEVLPTAMLESPAESRRFVPPLSEHGELAAASDVGRAHSTRSLTEHGPLAAASDVGRANHRPRSPDPAKAIKVLHMVLNVARNTLVAL